jgi:hypothetical protein
LLKRVAAPDWLVDIAEEFKVQRSTLFLSVHILDRALDAMPTSKEKLQLLGCASFLIASKLEEVCSSSWNDFIFELSAPRKRLWWTST